MLTDLTTMSSLRDYKQIRQVGKGSYGEVVLVKCRNDGKKVSVFEVFSVSCCTHTDLVHSAQCQGLWVWLFIAGTMELCVMRDQVLPDGMALG